MTTSATPSSSSSSSGQPAPEEPVRVPAGAYAWAKRVLDVAAGVFLLVLFAPLGMVVAVAVKLDSRGPVFFVNRAVGRDGREFPLFKFRSMHPACNAFAEISDLRQNVQEGKPTACDSRGPLFKTALVDSKRITRLGRILRRTSLDELPQLWNVLRGDMSLVGPRPSLPAEVALYEDWQRQRLLVRPGLTGLYQVTARNRVPVADMVRIDLDYIRRSSASLDFWILCKTPGAMLRGL